MIYIEFIYINDISILEIISFKKFARNLILENLEDFIAL